MLRRREWLAASLAAASARALPKTAYRAAIIGHTGRRDYGHDWDTSWNNLPDVQVVAIADPVERGRAGSTNAWTW